MKVEILGAHHCETLSTRMTCLLIDRVIAIEAGSLTSSLSAEDQRKLKAVLITHHHFDHIRDLATFGMNVFTNGPMNIYATESAFDIIATHLINGVLYPDFQRRPSEDKPAFKFNPVEPLEEFMIDGYAVLPFPVNHNVPTVGYQVKSTDGKTMVYTGDTSRNPASTWQALSPQLIVTEVCMPNDYEDTARETGHMTPQLLKEELEEFRRIKGYIPPVVAVHINPHIEETIREEIAQAASELGSDITPGFEGMKIVL